MQTVPDHGETLPAGVGAVGGARGWKVRARVSIMIMCCRSTGNGSTGPDGLALGVIQVPFIGIAPISQRRSGAGPERVGDHTGGYEKADA
jgi:hypothetical protein